MNVYYEVWFQWQIGTKFDGSPIYNSHSETFYDSYGFYDEDDFKTWQDYLKWIKEKYNIISYRVIKRTEETIENVGIATYEV